MKTNNMTEWCHSLRKGFCIDERFATCLCNVGYRLMCVLIQRTLEDVVFVSLCRHVRMSKLHSIYNISLVAFKLRFSFISTGAMLDMCHLQLEEEENTLLALTHRTALSIQQCFCCHKMLSLYSKAIYSKLLSLSNHWPFESICTL